MTWTPPSPDYKDAKMQGWFPAELGEPGAGRFELGLVLGGTVSAGAYTAGVLDFLIEALDNWALAVETNDPDAPRHQVVVKVIAGASGGGVNAATLARTATSAFPHIAAPTDAAHTGNPFFDIWVNQLDIAGMLDTSDLSRGQALESLLNVAPIDRAGYAILNFVGQGLGEPGTQTPKRRPWLDDTLAMFLTLTNLRGVPYTIDFRGGLQSDPRMRQSLVCHGDHARFEVDTRPNCTLPLRPDAFGVSLWREGDGFVPWTTLRDYGVATGAFPVGLKPRDLVRPSSHYAYRTLVLPQDNGPATVEFLKPEWDLLGGPDYQFAAVDGGATNNAPVELARTTLAGLIGRNRRDGQFTKRAVLLIDPFAEAPQLGPQKVDDLMSSLMPSVLGLVGGSRYETADLMLAADPSVFSRYMITARRGDTFGAQAIASSGLWAFLGFFCRAFRQHDFLLGRRNAYEFLKNEFALPDTNSLFNNWTTPQRTKFAIPGSGSTFLPLIPLFGSAAMYPPVPVKPVGALDVRRLRDPIAERVKAVVAAMENSAIPSFSFAHAYLWFAVSKLREQLTDMILAAITKCLHEANLG